MRATSAPAMIWQVARVVDCNAQALVVRIDAPEQCQRCARGEGCGAGVFSRLFARRETRLILPPGSPASVGEWVRLGVTPAALAVASARLYGLGLLGLLGGAWLGQSVASAPFEDLAALMTGLAGLAVMIGPLAVRWRPVLNPVVERLSCSGGDAKSSSSEH